MGYPLRTPPDSPSRPASAFSAACGAVALGLTVAACYGLAHAVHTLLGLPAPGPFVHAAGALLGVPAALLTEAGTFRLVTRRPRGGPHAPRPDSWSGPLA